jgi:hypothetical protein
MIIVKLKRFIKSFLGKAIQPTPEKLSKIDLLRAGGLKVGKKF